jgi:hypothetical protein
MAKGSPDNQHELIVTGIGRCLKAAYTEAKLSFGKVIPDIRLKPDIFVDHLNEQRWAYEVVNKNRPIQEIEAKHRKYAQAGVQAHWILWQTLGPEKPLDDTLIAQSMWISDEIVEVPRRYKLNRLQRTLACLGDGYLYVFSIYKPFLDVVESSPLKLVMAGLDVYQFAPDHLDEQESAGDWAFVPLPYLVFNPQGRPCCSPVVDGISPDIQSLVGVSPEMPVFLQEQLTTLDTLLQTPKLIPR